MNIKENPTSSNSGHLTAQCLEETCAIQFMLELLGSKWSVPILRELFKGDRRTHELLDALPKISSKTLTLRLRELELYGLVERTVYPEIPPHVSYALTEKGRELQLVFSILKQVGERWLGKPSCVCPLESRQSFD